MWELAVCAVTPDAYASSPAGDARPSSKALSIAAQPGSAIRDATTETFGARHNMSINQLTTLTRYHSIK